MPRVGDLASQVAQQLQDDHLAVMEAAEDIVDEQAEALLDPRKMLFAKIEFSWRTSDARILSQLRAAGDRAFRELYIEAFAVLDTFYASLRVAELNEYGVVKRDGRGRICWQKDSRGNEIEDWGRLTGDDLEKCLFDLTRLKLALAPQLNELLLEAVFAKHIADDAHKDGYAELIDGTVGDRNAHASKVGREDKYRAFFRYWLHSQADVFMREISNFCRILERIRYWRIEGGT